MKGCRACGWKRDVRYGLCRTCTDYPEFRATQRRLRRERLVAANTRAARRPRFPWSDYGETLERVRLGAIPAGFYQRLQTGGEYLMPDGSIRVEEPRMVWAVSCA